MHQFPFVAAGETHSCLGGGARSHGSVTRETSATVLLSVQPRQQPRPVQILNANEIPSAHQ